MLEPIDYLHKLRELESLDATRKSLVRLAIIRARTLSLTTQKVTSFEKTLDPAKEETIHLGVQKNALDYERRIAALKLQLATKDQVHEAKIDGFKQLIARLQSQLEAQSHTEPAKRRNKKLQAAFSSSPSSARKLSSSSFFSPARTSSGFNFPSPFGDRAGKGNSFSVSGINSSIASQASLKLSKGKAKDEEVFSPNNSSAEATPNKTGAVRPADLEEARLGNLSLKLRQLLEPPGENQSAEHVGRQSGSDENDADPESSNFEFSATRSEQSESAGDEGSKSKDASFSEPEDLFQSANGTFDHESSSMRDHSKQHPKKSTKKRIRLFSSEASKILVELQSKINEEDADPNSLDYYGDDNFKDDFVSPTRSLKRNLEQNRTDKAAKKRHVFKI